jgi:hypothetical protein
MYEITKDIKSTQAREKLVLLSETFKAPVTYVNTYPSATKQEGKINAMQRFATLLSVVRGICVATVTSVFTGRIYTAGRLLQASVLI